MAMDLTPSPRFIALTLIMESAYLMSLLAGAVCGRWRGAPPQDNPAQLAAIERQFGRFRDGVRSGDPRTIAHAAWLVFLINSVAGLIQFTVFGVLLFPIFWMLLWSGWQQGQGLIFARGTRPLSTSLYFGVGALEWVTYPISCSVGAHLGLALLWPGWVEAANRSGAFLCALGDGLVATAAVLVVLFLQSWLEILYVRAVLRRGGTGVPLALW